MPIITVTSGKGGVGKTTTSAALVGGFVRIQSAQVVAVDADYGCSLTRLYGYDASVPILEMMLDGKMPFEAALNETEEVDLVSGRRVHLVPTDKGLSQIPYTPDRAKVYAWRDRLREFAKERIVVIDTSDNIDSTPVEAAILAADILAIPTQLEPKGYQRTLPEIAGLLLREQHQPEIMWLGTTVNLRSKLSTHMMQSIREDGVELLELVPDNVAVNEADFARKSVVGYAPRSKAAKAYLNLAGLMYARLKKIQGASAVASGGGRTARTE